MFLSMNWISDFVDLSGLDKESLIRRFTLSTAEVEDIYVKGADLSGVVIARILSVENHPNSKKLHLLKVDAGDEILDIVCGAPNVRVGLTVPLAKAGAVVSGRKIEPCKVGGYMSYGMCCSEEELGISADNSGLMEITDDIPLGTDFKKAYAVDDIVFEVDNKSLTNRPDLWGHYGIAREFATLTGRPLLPVKTADLSQYRDLSPVAVDVQDPELCFRYTALKVENITKHQSPVNMRIRLFYCGSRAINLLADLTNYVMMELGQPMHAFDLRRVDRVEVRRFPAPFSFETLDSTERRIDENMLMICSNGDPVAVAGVMGGKASEIEDDTSSLLLESATFDGVSIRKTSARLGLRTDASIRYEKFLDPELCPVATGRFLNLLTAIDGDVKVISAYTDVYKKKYDTVTITIDRAYIDRYTGITITDEEVLRTLTALGFVVLQKGDAFTVTVPSWRATKDVTIKADLIEEITRIYGYDNFAVSTAKSPLFPVRTPVQKSCEDRAKDILVSHHNLHEVHSYIWSDAQKLQNIGIAVPENVCVINAQTPDHAVLRRSMLPTLLTFAAENKDYGDTYGLFEIGHTIEGLGPDGNCVERKKLGVVLFSKTETEESLYLQARDIALNLCRLLKHEEPDFTVAGNGGVVVEPWQHPVNTASVAVKGSVIGVLGVPHPAVKLKIDKKANLAFLELDMGSFAAVPQKPMHYEEPSRFPSIDIDLTFAMDAADFSFGELRSEFLTAGGEWLKSCTVADVFTGESGNSITYRFSFSSPDRTLSKAELQPAIDALTAVMQKRGISLKM